jgi:hypothetical protein
LLLISLKVIVTVDVAVPFAMTGPEPVIVEFAATAPPAIKTTDPSALETGVAIERIFVSDLSEVIVQVEIPRSSVTEHAP